MVNVRLFRWLHVAIFAASVYQAVQENPENGVRNDDISM